MDASAGLLDTTILTPVRPSLAELVELGAVDSELFCRTFFPKTVRQASPPFHRKIWEKIEGPSRLVNLQVFRGGAKTSLARMCTAKRIAYGISHTILYIGRSEGLATNSARWLKRQIEHNRPFAEAFRLRPGGKWQDTEMEIIHGVDEYPIWLMAAGITGSVRGILKDDYRPDYIVGDDMLDEENSATPDQRNKMEDLIYGALKESLAPASEDPSAKFIMLQTPMNQEDVSTKALNDPEWDSLVCGIWTPETADLQLDKQESVWPERWANETVRAEKRASIERNQLSIFLREKECKITSPETAAFRPEWLQYYEIEPEEQMLCVLCIDPVPPPTDIQTAKNMHKKDFEALSVVGTKNGNFYLLDYSMNRGHEPDWTIAEFFRLADHWKPRRVVVETTAYQATLKWLLEKAMAHQRRYFYIKGFDEKRKSKYDRIVDSITPVASNRKLFVRKDQHEFISQFIGYKDIPHEDLLETVAMGIAELSGVGFDGEESDTEDFMNDERDIPTLPSFGGGCP